MKKFSGTALEKYTSTVATIRIV